MIHRRLSIIALLLCLATTLVAAPRYRASNTLTHHVGVALAGFEANLFTGQTNPDVTVGIGGGAQLSVNYELQKSGFFFQIGAGVDFTRTAASLKQYDGDTINTVFDIGGYVDSVVYRYVYSDYREQHDQMRIVVPIRFGYLIGKWAYIGIGASYRSMPLIMNALTVNTRMYSQAEFIQAYMPNIHPEDDDLGHIWEDTYKVWIESDYAGKGRVLSATHEVAAEAEIGMRFALTNKLQLRAALYAGYDIPIISFKKDNRLKTLGDYSKLDNNPLASDKDNLKNNLGFNSMLDTNILLRDPHRLRAGLRLTLLFNVSSESEHCMCYE